MLRFPLHSQRQSPPCSLQGPDYLLVILLASALLGIPVTLALGILLPQGLYTAVLSAWLTLPASSSLQQQFHLIEAFPDQPILIFNIGLSPSMVLLFTVHVTVCQTWFIVISPTGK